MNKPAAFPRAVANRLEEDLKARIGGEVRFDDGSRALYANDGSNYRQVPIGVVIPRTVEDVLTAIELCRKHDAPVLARGGGTSLAGQCCNVAVVLDFSKHLNRILEIDPDARTARVEPGCILDNLRHTADERFHLTFGPDPATHTHNTLGGMIGNNSCGIHSIMAGRTEDNVEELDIVTYDGLRLTVGPTSDEEFERIVAEGGRRADIYRRMRELRDRYADLIRGRFPDIPRRVSGYSLPALLPENGFNVARALVGSEGTLVTVLGAKLRLVPSPPCRVVTVLGYPDVYSAADHVCEIRESGCIGLEGIDDHLTGYMRRKSLHPEDLELLPEGGGWLIVEFGGDTPEEAEAKAKTMTDALDRKGDGPTHRTCTDPRQQAKLWEIRESGLGATAHVPGMPDTFPGWEDSAVPPERLGGYLRDFRHLLEQHGYACALYGHFGDGCLHVRIDFDLLTREGIARYRNFIGEASDLVLKYGGSFSGEHGDGQSRGELLPKLYGPEIMDAFREFKAIWDPQGRMNPGKVIDARPITDDLRWGPEFRPRQHKTAFAFPEDDFSFANAANRCVGVGKCRRWDGGVMCPSFMVTHEEMHSTRGRARLLFEMVHGGPLSEGWDARPVREALDLCLACKGCKRDCPVNVDMATYKAEFYHHYYKRRLRPRAAWSMGLIAYWSRVAERVPALANWLTHTSGVSTAVKALGGIHPSRDFPPYADKSFRRRFAERPKRNTGQPRVILFPDTFNDHFHPETAMAAVEVLEAAGLRVTLPDRPLCCSRPVQSWGMLGLARRQMENCIRSLGADAVAGVPIVVLEPACASVFRDELTQMFPNDGRAREIGRQTFTLTEYLAKTGFEPPALSRRAVVHAHCHHHAVLGFDDVMRALEGMGVEYDKLDSGCCGMAGSFGFEHDHYDVAMAAGERVLLPAARAAPADTLIVTDGFSCREQIRQGAGREALHTAQVLQMALRAATNEPAPEQAPADRRRTMP